MGTTLRLILDSIGDEEQRYIALRAKYLTLIVDRTDALISIEEDYLKQFLLEVDIVEAATKVASEAVHVTEARTRDLLHDCKKANQLCHDIRSCQSRVNPPL